MGCGFHFGGAARVQLSTGCPGFGISVPPVIPCSNSYSKFTWTTQGFVAIKLFMFDFLLHLRNLIKMRFIPIKSVRQPFWS